MDEKKKKEIRLIIDKELSNYEDKAELAKYIEHAYIFGPLGKSEHYNIDEIMALINETLVELTPVEMKEE